MSHLYFSTKHFKISRCPYLAAIRQAFSPLLVRWLTFAPLLSNSRKLLMPLDDTELKNGVNPSQSGGSIEWPAFKSIYTHSGESSTSWSPLFLPSRPPSRPHAALCKGVRSFTSFIAISALILSKYSKARLFINITTFLIKIFYNFQISLEST
jgi:hypothetical protein